MAIRNSTEKNAKQLFQEFVGVSQTARSGVHTDVIRAGEGVRMGMDYALGHTTPVIGVIATAAKLLRKQPGMRLARKPVPSEYLEGDTLSRVLTGIINSSLTPADETAPQFKGTRKLMHACVKTEFYWNETLREIAQRDILKHPGADQVFFVDPEGITLRPTSDVESVTYLRPSVFGVPAAERRAHFTDDEFPLYLYDDLTAATISARIGTFLERTDMVYYNESK